MRPETSAMRTYQNHRRSLTITVICLTLLTVYVAPKLIGLHNNVHVGYAYNSPIEWRQPSALDQRFPLFISNTTWHFDFVDIESILWQSTVDSYGELVVDAETLSLLDQASDRLPKDLSPPERQRLSVLIDKSMPANLARRLTSLLIAYHAYQQDYRSNLALISIAAADQRLALLQAEQLNIEPRQQRYFGTDIATMLFNKKNLTTSYLIQRRIVSMMPDISTSQKNGMLRELNDGYKKAIKRETSN
ncbi:MAG: hypothetical protein ACI9WC_002490 [Arenicella sp.]|jgi:hypothetical protein